MHRSIREVNSQFQLSSHPFPMHLQWFKARNLPILEILFEFENNENGNENENTLKMSGVSLAWSIVRMIATHSRSLRRSYHANTYTNIDTYIYIYIIQNKWKSCLIIIHITTISSKESNRETTRKTYNFEQYLSDKTLSFIRPTIHFWMLETYSHTHLLTYSLKHFLLWKTRKY